MSIIINGSEMDKILDRIYVGSYHSATMLDYTNRESITHVLNCTSDTHEGLGNFKVVQLNINDGYEISHEVIFFAIQTIREAVQSGGKILVHCHAGISRSTGIVCGYLMTCGFSWDEARAFVTQRRPQAWPHPNIERSIKKALGQIISPATTLLGDNNDFSK